MMIAASTAPDRAALIAQRCEQAHETAHGWLACCPAHAYTSHTLSITATTDKVLLKCHAGCATDAIVAALHLDMADLFLTTRHSQDRVQAIYDYTNLDGSLRFQVVRYHSPKAFKQRRPDPTLPGHFVWNLHGVEPCLYHLAEVRAAVEAGRPIYLAEGEKDVDVLRALGRPATCNPGGAEKWKEAYNETLRGAHCVILQDNDDPGRRHAQQVARSLQGIAASVKVLALPDLPDKGDVTDWLDLDGGHTIQQLEALVSITATWTDVSSSGDQLPRNGPPMPHGQPAPLGLITQCTDDVAPEPTEWLWEPYIALGTICMLDGDPGVGKSLMSLQLAATVSRGWPFPDQLGQPTLGGGTPGTVLIMTREDSLARTVRPRLDACGADTTRIHVGVNFPDAEGRPQPFTLQHLPHLEATLRQLRPRLVILDPIQSFLGDINMNHSNQTRPLLDALALLAEQYRCTILALRHPAKPGEGIGKALHRGLGSVDIIGAARTGLFIEQYPGDETRALLAHTKSNLGPLGRTLIFSKQEGRFTWDRVTRLTAEDLAGSGRGPQHRAFLEACVWLEERLEGNLAWPSADILTAATEQEIAQGTLHRAKKALKVVSQKATGEADGGWTWRLPPLSLPPTTPSSSTSSCTSTTSTTSKSSDNRMTYEETIEDGGLIEETEVVEDVEVTAVVGGSTSAVLPCAFCQSHNRYLDTHGILRCVDCRAAGRIA